MKQVLEFADKYDMLPRSGKIICAVSGGADSVCLLHIIKSCAEERGLEVYAAHFNHCLRGEESDRDERFVRSLCRELGVELFCASGDVKSFAGRQGIGTEEAARIMRYEFFEKTAASLPGSRVATAHNADDNAETMLMNLSRGAGAKGLCGIPPVRDIYIRPLLCLSRADIIACLEGAALPHVEDSTNSEDVYTRNRLRHKVLPVLREINPDFAASALAASELLRADEALLERLSSEAVPAQWDGQGRIILSAEKLAAAELPLASRAVRRAAAELGCYPSAAHVRAVLALAGSSVPSARTQLPGNVIVRREYDKIIVSQAEQRNALGETVLSWNEWRDIPGAGLKIYFGEADKMNIAADEIFVFKKSSICGKITVRPRRSGDRICLDRRQGGKTLKKLFIEKKIPADIRDSIPVISDEKNILAIVSLGQSADAETEGTDCVVAVKKI